MNISLHTRVLLLALWIAWLGDAQTAFAQCPGITGSFTISPALPGCGAPLTITMTNTSTGTQANTTGFYIWLVNGVQVDSTFGTAPTATAVLPGGGSYTITMRIRRTNNACVQNINQTYTFGSSTPRILGGNGLPTFTPEFVNCIANPLNPDDSFDLFLTSPDTLKNYTIIWGDGSPNSTGTEQLPNTPILHRYNQLGVFTFSVVTTVGSCTDTVRGTVHNLRPPNTSILPIPGGTYVGCAPLTITYRDSSINALPGTILTWDFGAPGGVFVRNHTRANDTISFTYPLSSALAPCPRSISLTISNPRCGLPITNTKTGEVQVFNLSAANFSLPSPLCNPSRTYTFNNTSTNNCVGGDRYFWRTADTTVGWTPVRGPVTITFPTLGNQTLTLIDSNACGVDSITQTIFINRPPVAGFTANPKLGCTPLDVTFTDTSLGLNITRAWTFTGTTPTTANTATVNRTYNTQGVFPMQLTVSNGCLPNSTARDTIRVFTRPTAGIAGATNGCIPHKVRLTNTTVNARPTATYLWDFGNGDTSTDFNPDSVTYATPGTYIVRLIVSDTCGNDTTQVTIQVSTAPVASFTSTLNCRGDSTAFTNTSTVALGDVLNQVRWFFHTGDSITANAPRYKFPASGIFPVTLRIRTDKNCIDSVTANVNVLVSPNVSFTNLPTSICDGQVVSFDGSASTASGTITDYKWKFTATDSSMQEDTTFLFPGPGTYPVLFRATNDINCSTDTVRNIVVHPNPDARPTASVTCFGLPTNFRDSSTIVGAGNTITQWEWDFNNDGITNSASQNPSFTYLSVTTFRVKLRVGTNNNCFNIDSLDLVVNPLPNASIGQSHAERCKLDSFTFTNSTTGANNFIWRFGNGDTVSLASTNNIRYAYNDSGTFQVKMIATSAVGCRDSVSLTAISRPFPQANFVLNDSLGCAPKTFTFTNTSLLSNTYQWFVGSAISHTTASRPDTTVVSSGQVIPIRLVAFNNFGCKPDTLLRNLQTFSNPIPDFTISQDSGCGPLPVSFTNASIGGVLFTWSLGNGASENNINTATTYTASATNDTTYFVKLVVSNGPGCSDSITKQVRVFPNPVASFMQSIDDGCGPLGVNFTNTSVHNFGGNIDDLIVQWSLGNGNNPNTKNASTTYLASAIQDSVFNSKLVVTSRFGCKDSIQQQVRVYPNPTANFVRSVSQGCGPLGVSFTNTSTPNDTGTIDIMTFQWSFGNGNSSVLTNPTQSFAANATVDTTYEVKLVATSEHGCLDSTTRTIVVFPDPIAQFEISDTSGCSPHAVTFTNTSIHNGTGTIANMNFVWDLGNGFNSINQDAGATYFERPLVDTVYFVRLISANQNGCRDTTTQRVRVHPKPISGFSQNQTQGCGPLPVQFTSTSVLGHTFFWNFGDGNTSTSQNPLHVFQNFPLVDTTFITRFAVQSAFGCLGDTQSVNITTRFRPVADFVPSRDSICNNESIFFSNQSLGGINANWNFGNGNTTTAINPSQSFIGRPSIDTIYNVRLVVATPFNCRDTIIKPIRVTPPPQINISTDAAALCKLDSFTFFNNTTNVGSNRWVFNDGSPDLITTSTAPFKKAFADSGSFTVQYIATSPNGCIANANIPLISRPFPIARFTTNDTVACAPKTFTFNNTSQVANTYTWLVNNAPTTNATNRPDTTVTLANQLFSVKLIAFNSFGCKPDTSERFIRTIVNPTPDFVMNIDSGCGPLNVSFTNASIGATSFSWNFGNGSTTTLNNPLQTFNAATINDTIYQVKLTAFNGQGCRDSITKLVRVFPTPLIQFTPSIDTGCGPLAVNFVNNSQHRFGGSIADLAFTWNFDNGNTTTATNPGETFTASLTQDTIYQVKLTGTTLFGCKDSSVRNVRVYPNARAFFTTSANNGCGPLPVNILNQSSPNDTGSIHIMSFQWSFGNGQTSTGINPSTTFVSNPEKDTVYTIKLLALSEHGCPDSTTRSIRVYPKPLAQFAVSDTAGCGPLGIQFTNQSSPRDTGSIDIMTFQWSFGNGFNSIQQNPQTTYSNAPLVNANYTARLIAFSEHGCVDTVDRVITVFPNPVAAIAANNTSGCGPLNVQFANTTQLGNQFFWDFGNGDTSMQINPNYSFQSYDLVDSIYPVRMFAQSIHGCLSDTARINITTRANPVAAFVPSIDSACGNNNISFTNLSLGAFNNAWSFGNGQNSASINPTSFYFASQQNDTTYLARLVVTSGFGCRDTAEQQIRLFPIPNISFTPSIDTGCGPLPVVFNNQSQHKFGSTINDLALQWNLGNGQTSTIANPTTTYLASAIRDSVYRVKLVGTTIYGCRDSSEREITVFPNATAQFNTSVVDGCGPLNVQMLNASSPNNFGNINVMSFQWNFGNGQTSSAMNPNTVFVSNANKDTVYTIKLLALSEHGCADSTTRNIRVYPKPLAQFSVSDTAGCGPLDVQFTNQSIPRDTGSIDIMTFQWSFGNNQISTLRNPTTQYLANGLNTGVYEARLIALSEHNCADTMTQVIRAFPKPIANFASNRTQGCGPLDIQFTNTSQLGISFNWNFGNGDTSQATNPQYTFASRSLFDSIYQVRMVASSIHGCVSDTAFMNIIARALPVADFVTSGDSICGTGNISFFNASQGGFSSQWNFGNGNTSVALNPIQNFVSRTLSDTTYQVRLVISSPFQCRDTITKPVVVKFLPVMNVANIPAACTPYEVQFNNTTQGAVRYDWDFGDGNTSTLANPLRVFENPIAPVNRTYQVTLRAFTAGGCSDTSRRNIVVFPKPLVDFNAIKTNRCDTVEYQFLNSSLGASSFNWSFGNGNVSNASAPVSFFNTNLTTPITYNVQLVGITDNGCRDTVEKPVLARPLVRSNFNSNINSSCENLDVTFENLSLNASSYFWFFGDGSGSSGINPTKRYNRTGLYDVTLIAFDAFGCSDTITRGNFVEVFEVPVANFLFTPPVTRIPNAQIQFNDLSFISDNSPLTYQWLFGENAATSTLQNPSYTYNDSGDFVVTMIVTSNRGCSDTISKPLRVNWYKPIADFSFDPPVGCTPLTVNFTNLSQYANNYLWDFGDATQSTAENPTHTYTIPNTYNVALIARGPGGDSIVIKTGIITVHPLPIANFFVTPLEMVLPNATVSLTDLSFSAITWDWEITGANNRSVFRSNDKNPTYNFENEGEFSVRLIIENQFGCKDTTERDRVVRVIRGGLVNVPNVFTPNGDGVNDRFKPVMSGVLSKDYKLSIYNRWGMRVFETSDINDSWDGLVNGQPAASDAYVWVVEGLYEGERKFTESGTVTLLR